MGRTSDPGTTDVSVRDVRRALHDGVAVPFTEGVFVSADTCDFLRRYARVNTAAHCFLLATTSAILLTSCALITDNVVDSHARVAVPPANAYGPPPIYRPQPVIPDPDLSGFPHRGATAAMLSFDARTGVSPDEAVLLADRFAVEIGRPNAYKLISRSKMKEVLELQKYSIACSSTECAVEAGQLLGVEYMIYGSIGRIGSMFTVNVYVTSVEKGAVVAAATVDLSGQIEGLLTEGMRQAVNKLLQAVIEKGDK
jgi:TolB-like protein